VPEQEAELSAEAIQAAVAVMAGMEQEMRDEEVSEPLANRGASRMVRVYVECRPEYAPPGAEGASTRELPSGQEQPEATP
jgi:hypothetical protein